MRPQHLLHYGYTPTHQSILNALSIALRPVGEGVVRLLDPCAGTGEALAALAQALKAQGARVETYGVEIEASRAAEAARVLDHVIQDDWRKISMTEGSVSLALLNPPYDNVGGEASLEREIIRRAINRLAPAGVAVFVVPRRLLGWLGDFHMEWLALRTSPDPESPSQVILVGIRRPGEGRQPLPVERPLEEGFPEIPVPALRTPAPTFHKIALEPEDIAEALQHGPEPLDLLPGGAREEFRPLHPLRPGHRAAMLAAMQRTIHLEDGTALRVFLQHAVEETLEEDEEEGRMIRRTTHRPEMSLWVMDQQGLRQEPFSLLVNYAAAIDRALRVQARVEERPDGWPQAEPWEEEVLRRIGQRLPPMGGRQGLLPAQAVRAVGMARALLDGERVVFGVMEMGYGKTPIALTVRALVGARKAVGLTVILCPPHLVPKWEREARRLFPEARVIVPEGDGTERARQVREAVALAREGREVFLVLSREAAKLGPRHEPALIPRLFPGYGWFWACPCGYPAGGKGEPVLSVLETGAAIRAEPPASLRARLEAMATRWGAELEQAKAEWKIATRLADWRVEKALEIRIRALRRRLGMVRPAVGPQPEPPQRFLGRRCPACGQPYAAARPDPRRWPLAEIAAREIRRGGVAMLLIADEAHEYRHDSLQGRALSRLLGVARWAVLLTGTLFGGKASELFRLLRLTSPELRALAMTEEAFVRAYGHIEEIEVIDEARRYGRRVSRPRILERPGISMAVFRFLLNRAAFGSLADVAAALPGYAEERVELRPDFPIPPELQASAVAAVSRQHGLGGLMVWLQAALGYPNVIRVSPADGATDHVYDLVRVDPDGRGIGRVELLRLPVRAGGPTAKERWLVDFLRAEKAAGRRAVVLVQQTGRRPLAARLVEVLRHGGLRAEQLDPTRVPPSEREEWIRRRAPELDALVVHPRAVETGLDLIMFQTVVIYEVVYSAVTLLQAVRRVWRLGQVHPVRVIALAYQDTLEPRAWDVVAQKIAWAATIYGDFAASGLGSGGDPALDVLQVLARQLQGVAEIQAEAAGEITLAGIARPAVSAPLTPAAEAGPPSPAGIAVPAAVEGAEVLAAVLDPSLAELPLFAALQGAARPADAQRRSIRWTSETVEPLPDLASLRQGQLF